MKKMAYIIVLILILTIFPSCAKKDDEKDEYIEFDTASNADDIKDNDIQQNSDAEQRPTQSTKDEYADNEKSEDINITAPNKQHEAVDGTSQSTPLSQLHIEYTGDEFKEFLVTTGIDVYYSYALDKQKVAYDFSDVFKPGTDLSQESITEYEHPDPDFDRICYAAAYADGVEYMRYYYYPNQFPAKSSKYAGVDISSFELSDKTIEIWFFLPSETGSVYPHGSVSAQMYNLPEDMQNDPYVKMLAIKLPNGQSVLLYNHEQSTLYETIGTRFETMNTHFGWECNSADTIESIIVTKASNGQELTITNTDSLSILYGYLRNGRYTDNFEKGKTKFIKMSIKFKDGHSIYYANIDTTGIADKGIILETGFIEYIDKLFEQ